VSHYYADFMATYLGVPREKIDVVPLGINLEGFDWRRERRDGTFVIGYLARVAPEKGLLALCEAYVRFRAMPGVERARLEVAGYLAPEQRDYLSRAERVLADAGAASEFVSRRARSGAEDRVPGPWTFSVPTTACRTERVVSAQAMGCGVPVVQPRHGAFRR
jgi:glycosyltransferase involved in cell wall biosynthesis